MRTRQLTIATWLASGGLFRLQAALTGALLLGALIHAPARGENKQASNKTRVLQCPEKYSLGALYLLQRANLSNQVVSTREAISRTQAQGRVTLPAKGFLLLAGSYSLGENLQPLQKLKGNDLQILRLNKLTFKESELEYLSGLTGLQRLEVDSSDVSDKGLKAIAKLPNLVYLNLSRTLITGKTLGDLAPLKKLTDLELGHNAICNGNLDGVASIQSLRALRIQACQLHDRDLESISHLKNLESLTMHENKMITDNGIKCLAKMPKLEYLDIGQTPITAGGIKALKACPLKTIRMEIGQFKKTEIAQLITVFPKAKIVEDNNGKRWNTALFEPLH